MYERTSCFQDQSDFRTWVQIFLKTLGRLKRKKDHASRKTENCVEEGTGLVVPLGQPDIRHPAFVK